MVVVGKISKNLEMNEKTTRGYSDETDFFYKRMTTKTLIYAEREVSPSKKNLLIFLINVT